MNRLKELRRKWRCLIERIKLSELDYLTMKTNSQKYTAMMSTIECSMSADYVDVHDPLGNLITKIPTSKTAMVHINITDMLAAGGFVFNKNIVKFDVTGL